MAGKTPPSPHGKLFPFYWTSSRSKELLSTRVGDVVRGGGGVGEESEGPFNDLLLDLRPKQYLLWRL